MPGGGSEAVILPALAGMTGSTALATAPAWMGAALDGAVLGGAGSYLMGGNPLKGAALGGLGGGLFNKIAPQGLGGLFNGGSDAAEQFGPAAAGAAEQYGPSAALATPAASSGIASGIGKLLPYGALAGGAMLLDKSMAPTQVGPAAQQHPTSRPVKPMDRTQQSVDPQSYLTSGGNRSYFNDINPQVQYYAKGGLARYANGGSSSASSSNIPLVKGRGDGKSDSIPAMLSDGEYVFSAPAVSALGKGSNDAGARKLDKMHKKILTSNYKGGKVKGATGLGSMTH